MPGAHEIRWAPASAKQKRGLRPHFQFAKRKRGFSLRSATQVR